MRHKKVGLVSDGTLSFVSFRRGSERNADDDSWVRSNLTNDLNQYHRAASDFVKGNPEPYKMVFSHRKDVSLAHLALSPAGGSQVAETMERAASLYRDGEISGFDDVAKYVTPDLAYSCR
jgi:hypothetical protein